MTSIDEHRRKIEEHLDEIDDAIRDGMENKPITLGFHCSSCALEFLESYLHLENKIPLGKILKHDWFKRPHDGQKKEPLIERVMPVEFERKEEIYGLIYSLEKERNSLIYGKPTEEQIKKVVEVFLELREIFDGMLDGRLNGNGEEDEK